MTRHGKRRQGMTRQDKQHLTSSCKASRRLSIFSCVLSSASPVHIMQIIDRNINKISVKTHILAQNMIYIKFEYCVVWWEVRWKEIYRWHIVVQQIEWGPLIDRLIVLADFLKCLISGSLIESGAHMMISLFPVPAAITAAVAAAAVGVLLFGFIGCWLWWSKECDDYCIFVIPSLYLWPCKNKNNISVR